MPQYDYLKNQIDEIGRFLAQLVADFLKMKKGGEQIEAVAMVENSLKENLDLSLDNLIQLSAEEPIALLKPDSTASFIYLDHLAKILFHIGSVEKDTQKARKFMQQAQQFYRYLLDKDPIYSFERHQQIEKIEMILKG